jgi:hypothetical protein
MGARLKGRLEPVQGRARYRHGYCHSMGVIAMNPPASKKSRIYDFEEF